MTATAAPYKMRLLTPEELHTFVDTIIGEKGDHEEHGPNKGGCEKYQRAGQGVDGDSWCMDLILWALHETVGFYPLIRSGSCQEQRDAARAAGRILEKPQFGCIGLVIDEAKNHAHHAFVVTSVPTAEGTYDSWAGNTSKDGKSSNGTGVYPRVRSPHDGMHYRYILV